MTTASARSSDFHDLARHRVREVLLVARPYEAFLIEEAGQLAGRVSGEFWFEASDLHDLPAIRVASSRAEAERIVREGRIDLAICSLRLPEGGGAEAAAHLRGAGYEGPVVLLAFDPADVPEFPGSETVFLFQGDARILHSVVRLVEDAANAPNDALDRGVQVILLVEDNVRYYSSFLPAIHAELLHHSRRLVAEGTNRHDTLLRLGARPKILLCRTFEEASGTFDTFGESVLGIVSDAEFPRNGVWNDHAGRDLAALVRGSWPDVPILFQSSRPEAEVFAKEIGAGFVRKGSPQLLSELRRFLLENFGFGDFVFRLPDGSAVDRAVDLRSLEEKLAVVPAASIVFHAERNHFSRWLKARTEFELAAELRPQRIRDYASTEALRASLVRSVATYRKRRALRFIPDFDRDRFDGSDDFCRIGGGSLGGKARGLAFVRRLLGGAPLEEEFPEARISIPPAVVLGTDVFDAFLDRNDLRGFALHSADDAEIARRFLAAPLPGDVVRDLAVYVERVRRPVAVRSSSLLEDSLHQPFTGVYETFMLANDAESAKVRLEALLRAIRLVYASTFSTATKGYIRATPHRLEEEKMAVILQRIVGARHGPRFYPHVSGVARSHDFYPVPPLRSEDGVAAVALGFGRAVVDEGSCLRFSPRKPRHVLQYSSPQELLRSSQRGFWALDLSAAGSGEGLRETRFELSAAETDGTLGAVASTYCAENDSVRDGISRAGPRLVTFAGMLKHESFPLARLLRRLLELAEWGMGAPVEIEFAVNLFGKGEVTRPPSPDLPAEVGFLQVRPLALSRESEETGIGEFSDSGLFCRSRNVLGNGRVDGLRDVVVVDRGRFERAKSRDVARELARLNARLLDEKRPYVLVGVGRWGSADPWLGIPVSWSQISGVRVIVEAGLADLHVAPSQGTHFFQNLTSWGVGYFTVDAEPGDGFVDWEWLAARPAIFESGPVRHLRFGSEIPARMNGRTHEGVLGKPETA